jgi:aspartyl-tRNA(Asn)/glutamyl-tRNA(Gln) amidotransferase subunit B
MQEGSLRCDVNVSVHKSGEPLGIRTEIKNMNSFTFIEKAVRYESARQIAVLEAGGEIVQETRRYDDAKDVTESMRSKEDADDYRYFPEPDILPVLVQEDEVEALKAALPELPDSREQRYVERLVIPEKDAALLTKYRKVAEFFEAASADVTPKTVCNCILTQIFRRLPTDGDKEAFDIATTPAQLAALVRLVDEGKLRMNLAKTTLEQMLDSGKDPKDLIDPALLRGLSEQQLLDVCREALSQNPAAADDYRAGKEKAVKALVGYVMKATRGTAPAQKAEELLVEMILKG